MERWDEDEAPKRKRRRKGGAAHGEMAAHRLDRRTRRAAGGGLPKGHDSYSSAAMFKGPIEDVAGRNYRGVRQSTVDDKMAEGQPPASKLKDGGKPKQWIAGAIKHPGALHKELGVPEGEKIPAKKLEKAAHSDNPKLRRRAALAETLKGFH